MNSRILIPFSILVCFINFCFSSTNTLIVKKKEATISIEIRERYFKEVFDDFTLKTVTYGENMTQAGKKIELQLDVYQPKGDTVSKRPLFIYTHGGGFTRGTRTGIKSTGWLQSMAKSGFVVASISYRLIDVPQTNQTMPIAILNAVEDQRAAIRYFRKEATTYKIDTDQIFIGGYSAGAITSLHTAYLNSMKKVTAFLPPLLPYIQSHGGIEGSSGNPGFSSAVKGVVNIAGAIVTENLMDATSLKSIYSLHGEKDQTVKIGAVPEGLQGSRVIHEKAKELNIYSQLHAIENKGHNILYPCHTCRKDIQLFLAKQVDQS